MVWRGPAIRAVSGSVQHAGPGRGDAGRTSTEAAAVAVVVGVAQLGLGVPLVYHEVDGHLSLQAADVTLAEVVAQFMHLE